MRLMNKFTAMLKLLALLSVLSAIQYAAAQASGTLPGDYSKNDAQFVTAMPMEPVTVSAGSSAALHLRFRVAEGDHVNSSQPGSALLIPTKLTLSVPTDIAVGKVSYSPGH